MDRIKITGGPALNGVIPISGAKNAALPLMIASLLTPYTLELENVPRLADVHTLLRILANHGVDYGINGKRPGETAEKGQTLRLTAASIVDTTAPYELVSKMRAGFWVIAPLLARMGEARVSLPGGCAIGTRPVDLLLMALERLGAKIDIEAGYVVAKAPHGLKGAEIVFPKVTVGGTHTALTGAVLANGTTVILNAAREPEVVDLAQCLVAMGADIEGAGTSTITVRGVAALEARVIPSCRTASRPAPMRWPSPWPAATCCSKGHGPICCARRSTRWWRPAPTSRRRTRACGFAATARAFARSTSRRTPSPVFRPTCRRSSWR